MKLTNKPVERLFTFGCSFTEYAWSTWPEIIACDLDVPLYNYGKSGAGNQYISNMICQADNIFNFTENDLIIVCWTNICREDRWVNGRWITPGNIFTQGEYDEKFVKKYSDPIGYMIRDFASIKLIDKFLESKGCQYHFLAMGDIDLQIDQSSNRGFDERFIDTHKKLIEMYNDQLKKINPSFFKVLWKNDVYQNKLKPDEQIFGEYFSDGHPTPQEHYQYLRSIFDHTFKESTTAAVEKANNNLIIFIKATSEEKRKRFAVHDLTNEKLKLLESLTKIKSSDRPKFL